jgi:hypothetical protein
MQNAYLQVFLVNTLYAKFMLTAKAEILKSFEWQCSDFGSPYCEWKLVPYNIQITSVYHKSLTTNGITQEYSSFGGTWDMTLGCAALTSVENNARPQLMSQRTSCICSHPGQSMWELWWTKWHWDRFPLISLVFRCQYHSTGLQTHIQSLSQMTKSNSSIHYEDMSLLNYLFLFRNANMCS